MVDLCPVPTKASRLKWLGRKRIVEHGPELIQVPKGPANVAANVEVADETCITFCESPTSILRPPVGKRTSGRC
jgi:hypothetical protein